jgi:hypothetical protein
MFHLAFLWVFTLLHLINFVNNLKISFNYQFFERYIKTYESNVILENYYKQNLKRLAIISIDSWCDKKIFQIKLKDIFKNSSKIFNYYFRCFLEKDRRYTSSRIITNKVYFRIHNIKVALKHLDWLVWKKWEIFDTDKFLHQYENEYIDWEAIYNNKVKMIKWWWLCWFATILYQLWVKTKWIKILERHPHTYFYKHYYNLTWLDATVFFMSWILINLILKNNFYDWFLKTFWKQTKKNFIYETRFYSLKPPIKNKIDFWKIYLSWWNKCIDVFVKSDEEEKKITSCYKWIFR